MVFNSSAFEAFGNRISITNFSVCQFFCPSRSVFQSFVDHFFHVLFNFVFFGIIFTPRKRSLNVIGQPRWPGFFSVRISRWLRDLLFFYHAHVRRKPNRPYSASKSWCSVCCTAHRYRVHSYISTRPLVHVHSHAVHLRPLTPSSVYLWPIAVLGSNNTSELSRRRVFSTSHSLQTRTEYLFCDAHWHHTSWRPHHLQTGPLRRC